MASIKSSSQSSIKKQQSISNFFVNNTATTKPVPSLNKSNSKIPNISIESQEGDKENGESLFVSAGEEETTSYSSRRHSQTPKRALEDVIVQPRGSHDQDPTVSLGNKRRKVNSENTEYPTSSCRTAKYVFSSSPGLALEEQSCDSETLARK